jgi:hypothetical protein
MPAAQQITLIATSGGTSSKVAVSTTSAQSAAISAQCVVVIADVNVFFRRGVNPTALADGTDQLLLANTSYRLVGHKAVEKFAFITATGTGNVYITPDA